MLPRTASAQAGAADWTTVAGTVQGTRYSGLAEITVANVGGLVEEFAFDTGVRASHEGNPLVVGHVMYVVGLFPNTLFALDLAQAGKLLWKYTPSVDGFAHGVACCDTVNRGAACADGKIVYNVLDDTTVAVDAATGKLAWRTRLGDPRSGMTMTMAPLAVGSRVFVGNSGGELGIRGWMLALTPIPVTSCGAPTAPAPTPTCGSAPTSTPSMRRIRARTSVLVGSDADALTVGTMLGRFAMRHATVLACLVFAGSAASVQAHDYTLQFTPNHGARNLVVAGYAFTPQGVVGTCSYTVTSGGGSGRGGGYHSHTTRYDQTCAWDFVGNLLTVTPGAPGAPLPLSSDAGRTVYARNAAGDTTGIDAANGGGFIDTPSAQYAWGTPSGGFLFPANQKPVKIALIVQSVGDLPLTIDAIQATGRLARAKVAFSTCRHGPIAPGKTCAVVVTYDPRGLPPGDDPYTAYDTLTVGLASNSGTAPDFTETVEVPVAPN